GTGTTSEDHPTVIDLGTFVSDTETSDANLTYTPDSLPTFGVLSGTGQNRTYTPNTNFNGTDSFTYHVTDRGDPDNCGAVSATCAAVRSSAIRTVSIRIYPVANLSLTAAAMPNPVVAGQPVKYTFTVGNSGPAASTGSSLVVALPAG